MIEVALAQLRPLKGAYQDNLRQVADSLGVAGGWDHPADLVVFPEAALTGYFLEGGVRDLAVTAEQLFDDLMEQHAIAGTPPVDVAIGFYEVWRNRLYNSALYATLGGDSSGIRHVHRKVFLPTYGVFDEERFVEAGRSVAAFDTSWGRAAMLVCEDAWHSIMPTLAALDGAQLLIVLSATPARGLAPGGATGIPTNLARWDRLAQDAAEEHGVFVVVSQLVGFEGGKAFAGGSLAAGPDGSVLARGPVFEQAVLPVSVDLEAITRVRADLPLLADLEVKWPHLIKSRGTRHAEPAGTAPSPPPAARRRRPPVKPGADPLHIDPELTWRWLVEFLRDEVTRRRGFEQAVVGLSGGVDSALVASLAAAALGPDNVTALRMPYRTSSRASLEHAQLVVDSLGINCKTVEITSAVDSLIDAIGDESNPNRRGNIMARMRMITLFDQSAALGALPLGTGNKTERLLGYFTWHADDSPPVNPIGDLFKVQVWQLARHAGIPEVIVDKPASADLIRGQTDEGDLGISYPRADMILHGLLSGSPVADIEARGFTADEIELVRGRLESTHWKRRLPTVAMVSQTAIGEYYLRPVDY